MIRIIKHVSYHGILKCLENLVKKASQENMAQEKGDLYSDCGWNRTANVDDNKITVVPDITIDDNKFDTRSSIIQIKWVCIVQTSLNRIRP